MEIQEVNENVSKLHDKVDEVLVWKQVHRVQHETVDRDMTEVRDTLYGNPTPESGLVSRVARLWNNKANISQWKSFWMSVLRGVLTASIFGVIVWFLMMYKGA